MSEASKSATQEPAPGFRPLTFASRFTETVAARYFQAHRDGLMRVGDRIVLRASGVFRPMRRPDAAAGAGT